MRLDPETYRCDEHSQDLTDAVSAELATVPVMSFGIGFARFRRDRRPNPRGFSVVVTCPEGEGHQVVLRGLVDDSK